MTTADTILSALIEQVACYRRLAQLAESQHHFVEQSQPEQLLSVLTKRQEVLERISALEKIIAPARKDWTGYCNALGAEGRNAAEKLVAETRSLLEEIMSADRNDTLVLQQRKIEITRQMANAGRGQQVNRRYAAAAYGATRKSTVDVHSS
jgi:hypothetical protein